MKILIVNKYYYYKGGDCTYALELEKLLKNAGHHVAFFSMHSSKNFKNEFEKYFVPEVDFKAQPTNYKDIITRPFGSKEVQDKFSAILSDFLPDVIHLHNIHSHISPAILKLAKERHIPIVWTMHDYKLVCPAYICQRESKPCQLCFTNKYNVIKHKCINSSFSASTLGYLEARYWNASKVSKLVDYFICPSRFMHKKLAEGGIPSSKLIHLPYFISHSRGSTQLIPEPKKNTYTFFGRLVQEKGIRTLLNVASKLPDFHLNVIGDGPLYAELTEKYKHSNITFHGFLDWASLMPVLLQSSFTVTPSEWFENYPFSVIESLSLGIPVLGAGIGGIPELIDENLSGRIFKAFDEQSLKNEIVKMFNIISSFKYEQIRKSIYNKLSAERHLESIETLYTNLTAAFNRQAGVLTNKSQVPVL